jgi:hypothetical protein
MNTDNHRPFARQTVREICKMAREMPTFPWLSKGYASWRKCKEFRQPRARKRNPYPLAQAALHLVLASKLRIALHGIPKQHPHDPLGCLPVPLIRYPAGRYVTR